MKEDNRVEQRYNGSAMNIGICDDQPEYVQEIMTACRKFLQRSQISGKVSGFYKGKDMLCRATEFDIVILDVEMPELSGLQVAQRLCQLRKDIMIIFLTHYEKYIFDSFDFRPLGYLTKPVKEEKLFARLEKAMERLTEKKKIILCEKGVCYSFNLEDVLYIESLGDTSCIFFVNGDYHESRLKMWEWQEMLPTHQFVFCSRSSIVALQYINRIEKDIILINGQKVDLPRRNKKEILLKYMKYIKEYGQLY